MKSEEAQEDVEQLESMMQELNLENEPNEEPANYTIENEPLIDRTDEI